MSVDEELEKLSQEWAKDVITGLGGKLFSLLERAVVAYEKDVGLREASAKVLNDRLDASSKLLIRALDEAVGDGRLPRS